MQEHTMADNVIQFPGRRRQAPDNSWALAFLRHLPPAVADVMRTIYFHPCGAKLTHEQAASRLGMTVERVRRLEKKGLAAMPDFWLPPGAT